MKNPMTIFLRKSLLEVKPHPMTSVNVDHTRCNFFENRIENLRQDHVVAHPSLIFNTSIKHRLRKRSINERQLVFGSESHYHRTAPCIVILTSEQLRNKSSSRTFSLRQVKRTCRIGENGRRNGELKRWIIDMWSLIVDGRNWRRGRRNFRRHGCRL
jgi:hypothetical protein